MGALEGYTGLIGDMALATWKAGINTAASAYLTQEDRRLNYEYNEKAAENADRRTRALYEDIYSPEALLKRYNAAGLSPSMMFGGTPGQGGMQGAQGAGPNGLQTAYYPMDMLSIAQAQNLMAQTKKTEAETDTIEGKNSRGEAEIAGILLQNGNIKAATKYLQSQDAYQEMTNAIMSETLDEQMETIRSNAEKAASDAEFAYWEAAKSEQDWQMREETWNAEAQGILNNANKLFYEALVAEKQVDLTQAQTDKINKEIEEITANIAQGWKKLQIDGATLEAQKEFWNGQLHNGARQIEAKYTEIYANNARENKGNENDYEDKDVKAAMQYLETALLLLTLKGKGGKVAAGANANRKKK